VAGPKIMEADGNLQLSARKDLSFVSGLLGRTSLLTRLFPKSSLVRHLFPAAEKLAGPATVDWVSGACMTVRRRTLEEIGPMDERFFMYFEDADLCRRARDAGWLIYYLPDVEILHHSGASSRNRLRAIWDLHKSAFLYHRKHGPHGPLGLYNLLVLGGLAGRALVKLLISLSRTGERHKGTPQAGTLPQRLARAREPGSSFIPRVMPRRGRTDRVSVRHSVRLPFSTVNATKNAVQSLRRLVPKETRARLREAPGTRRLFDIATVQNLLGRTELKEADKAWTQQDQDRSRTRWREVKPNPGLTWGRELTGEAFVSKVESYASFDDETTLLEIGAGYGRILRSFLARDIPFGEYYALDISKQNIEYLRKRFPQADVQFMEADIESASLPFVFDVGFSSLTFKHLYPSFEASLRNCSRYMSPGGTFIFDLIEGPRTYFTHDNRTYIRQYRREEVLEILGKAELKLLAFDEVVHDPQHTRLLVVAAKPN
jgi:SAM-dependent methyltransferase